MKIYIIGVGGVGGFFGGLMAKGGLDVTFVARGEQYHAIKSKGLLVHSVDGDFLINPAKVIENISDIYDAEAIFVTVKTYDNKQVAQELSKVITPQTIIITIQNGMDNDLRLRKLLPNASIFPGAAYVISAKTEPGVISQTGGQRRIVFGDRTNPTNTQLVELSVLLQKAGVNALASDDIARDVWRKYILIVAFSSLTALNNFTIGQVLADPKTKVIYEGCVQEAISVAQAQHINLPANIFEEIMTTTAKTAPDSKSSLLLDIINHRSTEVDTLIGALVHLAEKNGVKTPISQELYNGLLQIIAN